MHAWRRMNFTVHASWRARHCRHAALPHHLLPSAAAPSAVLRHSTCLNLATLLAFIYSRTYAALPSVRAKLPAWQRHVTVVAGRFSSKRVHGTLDRQQRPYGAGNKTLGSGQTVKTGSGTSAWPAACAPGFVARVVPRRFCACRRALAAGVKRAAALVVVDCWLDEKVKHGRQHQHGSARAHRQTRHGETDHDRHGAALGRWLTCRRWRVTRQVKRTGAERYPYQSMPLIMTLFRRAVTLRVRGTTERRDVFPGGDAA